MLKSIESLSPLKTCDNLKNLHLQSLSGQEQNPVCELSGYRANVL